MPNRPPPQRLIKLPLRRNLRVFDAGDPPRHQAVRVELQNRDTVLLEAFSSRAHLRAKNASVSAPPVTNSARFRHWLYGV